MENNLYVLNMWVNKKEYGSLIKDYSLCYVYNNKDELIDSINNLLMCASFDEFKTNKIEYFIKERFEISYNYFIEVLTFEEGRVISTEYDCSMNVICKKQLPDIFDKYVYCLNLTIYDSYWFEEPIGFLLDKHFDGVYSSEEEAISVAKSFVQAIIYDFKTSYRDYTDDELFEYLYEYIKPEIRITKIPLDYYGVKLYGSSEETAFYEKKLKELDRDSISYDELYDELMKFVMAEIRYYDIDCNFTEGMWALDDFKDVIYKSYEDFKTNEKPKHSVGDIVTISDYSHQSHSKCISDKLIGKEEYDSFTGIYVVLFSNDKGVIDSENPLFWSRGATLEGVDGNNKYNFYNDFVNDRYCIKYNEELPKDSFISLIRQSIIEGKFTRENIVEILEGNDIVTDMGYKDTLYYKDIPLFKEFLRNSDE